MFHVLSRLTKYYLLKLVRLPMSLWIDYQWAKLRHRETQHLMDLDDYLLRDMGLKKVGGRIEALHASRIEPGRNLFTQSSSADSYKERIRDVN